MTNIAIVRADARIQRCAIADPFKNYKPEEEKHIEQFKVEKNEISKQLKDMFNGVGMFKGVKWYICDKQRTYDEIVSSTKEIQLSSQDITNFSIALSELQDPRDFKSNVAIFLGALVNESKDEEFTIITEHLSQPIDFLGYMNSKNITIQGNAGAFVGQLMTKGSIIVKGNAGHFVGHEMKGGTISVEGDYKSLSRDMKNCFHKGKQIVKDGKRLI